MESVTLKTWIYVTQAKTLKVFFGNLEMSAKDNLSRFSLLQKAQCHLWQAEG